MRDITRITEILKRLQNIWEKNPDMRLAQVISNVFPCTPDTKIDMFFFEDEEFISIIEMFYSQNRTYRIGGAQELKVILDKIRDRTDKETKKCS